MAFGAVAFKQKEGAGLARAKPKGGIPLSTAVVGITDVSHLEENIRIARAFEPLSEEEMAEMRALARS